MNDSTNMQDQFRVIVVDDNELKTMAMEAFLGAGGYDVERITGEVNYPEETFISIFNAYGDGKIPVIHLDEKLKPWSPMNGTEMMQEIVSSFHQGGILLTGSIDAEEQYRKWQRRMPKELNGWDVRKFDVMGGIDFDEFERILREYLDTKESKSEFKNR